MSPDMSERARRAPNHVNYGQSNKTRHLLYIPSQLLTNSLQDIKSSPSEFIKCCSSIVSLIVQLDYGLLHKVI